MIIATIVIAYWLIAGVALYAQPTSSTRLSRDREVIVFLLCLLIGGIAVPAKILAKAAS